MSGSNECVDRINEEFLDGFREMVHNSSFDQYVTQEKALDRFQERFEYAPFSSDDIGPIERIDLMLEDTNALDSKSVKALTKELSEEQDEILSNPERDAFQCRSDQIMEQLMSIADSLEMQRINAIYSDLALEMWIMNTNMAAAKSRSQSNIDQLVECTQRTANSLVKCGLELVSMEFEQWEGEPLKEYGVRITDSKKPGEVITAREVRNCTGLAAPVVRLFAKSDYAGEVEVFISDWDASDSGLTKDNHIWNCQADRSFSLVVSENGAAVSNELDDFREAHNEWNLSKDKSSLKPSGHGTDSVGLG